MNPDTPVAVVEGQLQVQTEAGSWEASPMALPHVLSFGSIVGGASHTYWQDRFDEARRSSRDDALVMENDCYLMGLMQERKLAVASLPWHVDVPDENDPAQAAVADALTRQVEAIPYLQKFLMCHLEAVWFGRYGCQIKPVWGVGPDGRRALLVDRWEPVNGDKIGHQQDGTPYVLVNASAADALPGAEVINTQLGRAVRLTGRWRERFVIHTHECYDADFLDAERGEAVHGLGVRSRVFWLNWLKLEYLGSVVEFMNRVGLGLTVWYYDAANPRAKEEAAKAAREQTDRTNLLVPRFAGDKLAAVERVETPAAGAELLLRMQEKVDEYIERYVVGQSGSAKSQSSGLGNEASAEFMADTKAQITRYDANNLAETFTGCARDPGVLYLMQKYTFPETVPGPANPAGFQARLVFDVETQQPKEVLDAAQTVYSMGISLKADEVRAKAGLSKPRDGDEVVKQQQQQPGAMPGLGGEPGPGGQPPEERRGWTPGPGPKGGRLWKRDGQTPPGQPKTPQQFRRALEELLQYAGGFDPDQPRDDGGQWTDGGGGGGAPPAPAKKKKRERPPEPVRGEEGTRLLRSRMAAAGIPLDAAALVSAAGVTFLPGRGKELPTTVAQHDPLSGRVTVSDHPGLSEKEKMEYATHELTHALDQKLGGGDFKVASKDPASGLGRIAADALAVPEFAALLKSHGYREHEMLPEATAYLGSRWARRQMGEPVSESPALDRLADRLGEVMMEHAGVSEGVRQHYARQGSLCYAGGWAEDQHPRGQPDNAGQFASGGGQGGHADAGDGQAAQGGQQDAGADDRSPYEKAYAGVEERHTKAVEAHEAEVDKIRDQYEADHREWEARGREREERNDRLNAFDFSALPEESETPLPSVPDGIDPPYGSGKVGEDSAADYLAGARGYADAVAAEASAFAEQALEIAGGAGLAKHLGPKAEAAGARLAAAVGKALPKFLKNAQALASQLDRYHALDREYAALPDEPKGPEMPASVDYRWMHPDQFRDLPDDQKQAHLDKKQAFHDWHTENEDALEQHSREHDAWEAAADRVHEAREAAGEKIQDLEQKQEALSEAIGGLFGKAHEVLSEAGEKVAARELEKIEAEEEADPEPEEPDYPDEPDFDQMLSDAGLEEE